MIRKTILAFAAVALTAMPSFAAEFGDLAGTYSGTTAKGGSVRITLPKSGMPSYTFRGESVSVNTSSISGKTVTMKVGSGGGNITLTSNGKGQMSYRYSFKGDTASATLTRQ